MTDIQAKVAAFVEELFQTHCDVSAAPETVEFYTSAVVTGLITVEAVAEEIKELGRVLVYSQFL